MRSINNSIIISSGNIIQVFDSFVNTFMLYNGASLQRQKAFAVDEGFHNILMELLVG